jgi:hypothetical protein
MSLRQRKEIQEVLRSIVNEKCLELYDDYTGNMTSNGDGVFRSLKSS